MLKNLKKVAAIVLSFAMAVQFGLADSYYVNAVEEPVEPQQEETTTTTPQEQEEVPTTEEETPQQQEDGQQQPAVEEEQPAAEEAQPVAEETSQDDSTNDENQASNEVKSAPVMAAMLADNPAATYSVEFKDQNGNSLGSKTVTVGNVADQFPGGKETIGDKTYSYIEARVVNATNEKEYTPITYVAVYDGVTYYSTNSVTGSPLDTTSEKLVVVLKEDVTQYSVKYTLTVDGTDKSSEIANYIALEGSESTVDTGTSFSFLVKPNKGFTVKSVKQDGKVLTADGTKYTTRNVVADSTISIELTEKKKAKITFTGSNTKFTYNGKTQNTGNNYSHNLTLSSTYETSVTELNFKLLGYLEWTSNSKELNKLAISLTYDGTSSLTGKSINIPTKPGETVETTLTDSLTAVVKKSSTKQSIGSGQYSYEYNVTLRSTKNIYDDIKITTNFKDSTSAELFVTSIVGVTSIYVNNKELDPSNSDASFINLNSNETYTFKFNVLPGYVPDASKIKVTGTVDGDDIGTVSIKKNTGSDKVKYPYYFTIKAAYGKTDYRIQVTAIQSEYKFVYKADGISSSNKLKGGEETAITAQRPKKENYVFKGWKIDSDESGKVYTSKEVVKVNDLIQYSKWDENENLSKITFTPVWIEADKAQQVTYRVVVHFDDGTEDKVYEATTVPGKDVKVFRSKLDTALGIDTSEYYVDPNQSFDLQNVKDGDTITINYCKRKEIVVNPLNDVPYNGESQKQEPVVTIKDDNSKVLQKDVDYILSYSEDTKNVGTVTVTVTGKGLYKGTQQVTYQITPKSVTVTGNNGNKVYGEADPELTATVAGTIGKDKVKYTVAREAGEDVGTYPITPSGDEIQGNYKVTYKPGEFEITKAGTMTLTPELTGKDAEKVYDGQPLSGGATATVKEGTTITYSTDGGTTWSETLPSITDVGTLNVTAKAENKNYEDVTVDYTLTVKHRKVTVTGNNGNKVYGEADPELTATVAGTIGKDKVKYTVAREAGEDVGTYPITPSGDEIQGNYKVTYVAGTLTITSQSIDPGTDPENPNPDYTGAKVNSPKDSVYDGKEHKWIPTVTDKADKKLEAGTDYTVEYSTSDFTNVGTIKVTITGKGNYTGTVKRSYKVTPKEYTVTTDSATKTYSGTALTAGGKVEGIVSGETVEFTTTGSQTEVGTSDNTYEFKWDGTAKKSNYKLAKESIGKLTVKAKSIVPDGPDTPNEKKTGITVSEPSDSKYDGKEHKEVLTVTDTKTGKELVAGTDYSVTYSSDLVNAGTVKVTVAGLGNYTGSFTKTYKITKRSVTLTSATVSKVYDGSALTNTSITVSGDGFVEGEGASYEVTGTQTEVGNSANAFEYKLNEKTLASNYNITKVVGTLTITAAPAPVTPATPSTPSSTTSTTPRTPSAPQVTTPAETVEKETTPKAEPKKEEKVEEEYTPKASPQYYWALINLICVILTVLFGLLLLISKRHKDEDDDEEDDETKQQTNNDDEEKEQEKKRGLFTRVLAVLIAIVSVVFFLVTEDLSLPWTWTDQWTIWMVVIGLVQIVVFFVGRKWKNVDNDDEDEEAQQA